MKKTTTVSGYNNIENVLKDVKSAIEDVVTDTEYCPKLIITIETEEN